LDKRLSWYILTVEALGAAFFAVFSAAYFLAIPSINVLSNEPIFKIPMTIFCFLFVVLLLVSLVVGAFQKKTIGASAQ
jgi:hypothetical protein